MSTSVSNPIQQLYLELHGRAPNQAELEYWQEQLANNTVKLEHLIADHFSDHTTSHLHEHHETPASTSLDATVAEQIQQLYIDLLDRPVDQAGLEYWQHLINGNILTIEQVRSNIINEQPEYQQRLNHSEQPLLSLDATAAEQIQQIYIGLLSRAADKAGFDYWEQLISSGALTIEQLRANIVNEQPEYQQGLGQMSRPDALTTLYQNLFSRLPDEAGLAYWATGGGAAVPFDQLVIALINGAHESDAQTLNTKTIAAQAYTDFSLDDYNPEAAAKAINNNAPTLISLSANTIAENQSGAVIGALQVTDPDSTDDHTFTVDDDRFEIVADQLRLKTDQSLDFESANQVNVTVTATDDGGLSINQLFAITITDQPEAPQELTLSKLVIDDNSAGAILGDLTITDQDAGDTHTVTLSDNRFEWVNNQVKLKSNQSLSSETDNNLSLTITATDSSNRSTSETFTVLVGTENTPPVFSPDNVTVETEINTELSGTVAAIDTDSPVISYSITTHPSNGSVQIDSVGNYIYTPNTNYSGTDSFVVLADDQQGGEDVLTVAVSVGNSQSLGQQFSRVESTIDSATLPSTGQQGSLSMESGEYWLVNQITYSFNQSVPSFYAAHGENIPGWQPLVSTGQTAGRATMEFISQVTPLTLTEVASTTGDINFNSVPQPGSAGYSYYPGGDIGGEIFLDIEDNQLSEYQLGSYAYNTLIHEIGHAVGLKHPHENPNRLDGPLDNLDYTVMSYTEARNLVVNIEYEAGIGASADYVWGALPHTFALYDIAALQAIYGANLNTATGNDTYAMSFHSKQYATIWDAGGLDTLDFSNATGYSEIDLRSGEHSSVDVHTIDQQIQDTLTWLASQGAPAPAYTAWVTSVYNQQSGDLYTGENNFAIARGVWIENVITGSGNDIVRDNAVDNNIQTGAGDDRIQLFDGGYDYVDGGSGNDTLELNVSSNSVSVTQNANGSYTLIGSTFAVDLIGIETISYSDTSQIIS